MKRYSAATRADPAFPWLDVDQFFAFPDPGRWDGSGLVAVGANLSPGMLVSAYSQGIFPWFGEDDPILWQSPDPRFVLLPEELRLPASLRKLMRKRPYELTLDRDFESVIRACASQPRPGQSGTWITPDMVEAYIGLHREGLAHSVEAYQDGILAGGLYGVSLGRAFFGESMFHARDGASLCAFAALALRLRQEGFVLIDSQARTENMERFGARDVPRPRYLEMLSRALEAGSSLRGSWGLLLPDFPDSRDYAAIMAGGAPC